LKHLGLWIILSVVAGVVTVQLHARWREEQANNRVLLAVDWSECRDLAGREGHADNELIASLKTSGVTAIVLPALTLQDLVSHRRVWPTTRPASGDLLDTEHLHFASRSLSEQAYRELSRRGAQDLRWSALDRELGLARTHGSFLALKDVEIGFDGDLINEMTIHGLAAILRVNADPWLDFQSMKDSLNENLGLPPVTGILFNSDDLPGGIEAMPLWCSWIRHHGALEPLFEFHASRAALQMAHGLAANTYRSHSIPALELKDLSADQEIFRWHRAVLERSNRILLMHASPSDSWPGFLKKITSLRMDLAEQGWIFKLPRNRVYWNDISRLQRSVYPWLAFLLAIVTPWTALWQGYSWTGFARLSWVEASYAVFLRMTLITLIGALVMTVLAQNPETRLEITPFRGIKAAFLLSWLGCIFILYSREEIRMVLSQYVRRWDIVLAAVVLAIVGYSLIRSGNASAAWKSAAEQGLRDRLEKLLWVRPRFKEFALGHPILLVGLYLDHLARRARIRWDGRPWIVLGMIGQVSIVNTFCHLHSPLGLAFFRMFNGLVLGLVIGFVLIQSISFLVPEDGA